MCVIDVFDPQACDSRIMCVSWQVLSAVDLQLMGCFCHKDDSSLLSMLLFLSLSHLLFGVQLLLFALYGSDK